MARLLSTSDPAWLQAVLADFDTFLQDHANCERKASAMALALVTRYQDLPDLCDAMLGLAREELDHYHAVFTQLRARGGTLGPDSKDPYVGALRRLIRSGREELLLDRLLVAGVVEARGCERFGLIAEALPEGELKAFYLDITRSEARHGGLFVRLAKRYYSVHEVDARLTALFAAERDIVAALAPRPALH
ncbi:MAG TPA: tRNA-(ms[2]io[6]A)-hydroxylase [Myxococcota bacterium]|nr:tRNA-(ms[2]io[6]A)-hydroxylase [Myxococcota bacterium]